MDIFSDSFDKNIDGVEDPSGNFDAQREAGLKFSGWKFLTILNNRTIRGSEIREINIHL